MFAACLKAVYPAVRVRHLVAPCDGLSLKPFHLPALTAGTSPVHPFCLCYAFFGVDAFFGWLGGCFA